ncbi:MAG: DUF6788 family protein [Thermodesulfobacteriota bacterium]
MLQGSLEALYVRCGKKGCRCEGGENHGPAYYLSYKEAGVTKMVYVHIPKLGAKRGQATFSPPLREWTLLRSKN